jgi:hypothetical protein
VSFNFSGDIYAQQFGSLLIAVLGLLHFSKREKPILILGFYGLNDVLFEIINLSTNFKDNIVGDVYTLLESLILLYFFSNLYKSPRSKKITIVLSIVYCVFYFFLVTGDWPERFGTIRMLRDLLMISCSLLYFYFLMIDMPAVTITQYPMFWIVAGFIFFFSGTFLLSLSMDYLVDVLKDDLSYVWPARNFFRFLFCLIVSYGLWLDLRLVKMKGESQR